MKIAVIGATGLVGKEILTILSEDNQFKDAQVVALASRSSIGKEVSFGEEKILKAQDLEHYDFENTDLAFFCAGSSVSKAYIPKALEAGCTVIDKSSHFRMEAQVPLIVPEVNGIELDITRHEKLISSPNCVAIPLSIALKPLESIAPIKRVVVSTYQSVSGAGQGAMDELFQGTRNVYMNADDEPKHFPKPIIFNVIPHIDDFNDQGITGEEEKVVQETQKILGWPVPISVTCVRVPTFVGHALSINVEFEQEISPEEARKAYTLKSGAVVVDQPKDNGYVTPIEVVGEDLVAISRVRRDTSTTYGLSMWVVCDNLRKGAALNAIQIAGTLV